MKRADLTPPLGWMGGTCLVVDRIEDRVRTPALREELSEKVEHGQKLTNPEAAKVYTMENERGGGIITHIRISPHAQYRMDQRAITVGDLRAFFMDFSKKLGDWKSQRSDEYMHYAEGMSRGTPVEWVDKRLGDLMVVFAISGRGVADIVTTYWEGEPDPRPGTCGTHPQHVHTARDDANLPGVKTLVKDTQPSKSDTGKSEGEGGKYPTQGLPSPPWSRSKPTKGPTVLNVPGESGSNSDGNLHEDRTRTKGTPGERSPAPDSPARIGPVRRPGMTTADQDPDLFEGMDPALISQIVRLAGMYPPSYPTGKTRHHKQRGEAYRYDHKRYQRQRGRIIQRQKRRYKKWQGDGRFERDRSRRKETPERFKTKPNGGAVSIADRNKKQREKVALGMLDPVPVYFYSQETWGWLLEVSPLGTVHYELKDRRRTSDMDDFFDAVIVDEDRLGELEAYLDAVFEYDPDEEDADLSVETEDGSFDTWLAAPDVVSKLATEVIADFFREQRPPDMSSDAKYDRANNHDEWRRKDRKHLEDISEWSGTNDGNPGSRVLPSGAGHIEKEAALIQDIRQGCAPDLEAKARGLRVSMRRVDAANAMWLFDVQGSTSPYRVRLQAVRKGNVKSVAKVHVKVSCSCPFWQFQGPEHWAKQGDYLYGSPRGMATRPDAKDPSGQHRACKHVLAVLHHVTARKWDIPELRRKQAGLHYLASSLVDGGGTLLIAYDPRIERLAARYLASQEVQ